IPVSQFLVRRSEFFDAGLQLFLGGFQFFVVALKLLVARLNLFVRGLQFLRVGLLLLQQRLRIVPGGLELLPQLGKLPAFIHTPPGSPLSLNRKTGVWTRRSSVFACCRAPRRGSIKSRRAILSTLCVAFPIGVSR